MSDISYYRLALWRYICERDRQETDARIRQQSISPPPEIPLHLLHEAMQEMGDAAGRVSEQFTESAKCAESHAKPLD